MKKILTVAILLVLILGAIIPSIVFPSYAVHLGDDPINEITLYNRTDLNEPLEESKTTLTGDKYDVRETQSQGAASAGFFFDLINIIPTLCSMLMTEAVKDVNDKNGSIFTIENAIFGRIDLFNIEFGKVGDANTSGEVEDTDTPSEGTEGNTNSNGNKSINQIIKENVAIWYNAIRNLTIVLMLLVLIYIGVRMAMSTLSKDQAKYKKMLKDWVVGFILLFVLHYIIIISINLSGAIVKILDPVKEGSSVSKVGFERELLLGTEVNEETKVMMLNGDVVVIRSGLERSMRNLKGWYLAEVSILYWVLIYYQLKFFFLYIKRLLTMGFLITIAPLVTVTYSIDVMGDNKAQAFKTWMKEFMVNVFIQPVHAIVYLIFMVTAFEIVAVAPLFGIVFLMGMSRGEKIIKEMLDIRGMSTIHSMSESFKLRG